MHTVVWHLHRDTFHKNGVLGKLTGGGGLVFETIENPNTLIEPGEYTCVRDFFHRGNYPTFEIIVEGRDRLLFHAANYADQLEGCIAPGISRGWKDDTTPAVWQSRIAFNQYFEANVDVNKHVLIITESPH